MANFGARLMALAAILGAGVSVYNYFDPMNGIAGTLGVLLVIVASLILFALAVLLGADLRSGALRAFIATALLLGIAGTAFAAALLHSTALVAAMAVCLLGWVIQLFSKRHAPA